MQKMSDLADLYPGFASEWINTSFGPGSPGLASDSMEWEAGGRSILLHDTGRSSYLAER